MKRLMLDHFRRYGWLLVAIACLGFLIGGFIARSPDSSFEFWILMITMWSGATLIQTDLKNGLSRTLAVLPLTNEQIGRSWWIVSVAIPAVLLTLVLLLSAFATSHFGDKTEIPTHRIIIVCLFALVWYGSIFVANFINFDSSNREKRPAFFTFIKLSSIAMFFGSMLLSINASKDITKSGLILGFGAILTVYSWFLSKKIVPVQTRQFHGLLQAHQNKPYNEPRRYGGIRFLFITIFVRAFLMGVLSLTMVYALFYVMCLFQGEKPPFRIIPSSAYIFGSMVWALALFQLIPTIEHLRFLRTLPIRTTTLTALILVVSLLPVMAVGLIASGIAGVFIGSAAALPTAKIYFVSFVPAAICISFAFWTGLGKAAYAIGFSAFVASSFYTQHFVVEQQGVFFWPAIIVPSCIAVAFLSIHQAFLRGTKLYRRRAEN